MYTSLSDNPTHSNLRSNRQSQLTTRLLGKDFRNSMSDSDTCLLYFLLREPGSDADFQGRLELVALIFAAGT